MYIKLENVAYALMHMHYEYTIFVYNPMTYVQHLSTPGSSWHRVFSRGQIVSLPKLTGGQPEMRNLQHILYLVSVNCLSGMQFQSTVF